MGEVRSASHFCLLLALGHQPVEMKKGELLIKLKLIKGLKYRQGTYNIIGNLIVEVNHVALHVSRYPEQMLLLFFPPLFV